MNTLTFEGHIMGAAFSSGDLIVAGRWHRSPFGPFADVMWRRPDGRRVLLAPTDEVATFLARHYRFDELRREPVRIERRGGEIEVDAGPVILRLAPRPPGFASLALGVRPRRLRAHPAWLAAEEFLFRPLVAPLIGGRSAHVRGRTAAGAREWYSIHDLRGATARATIEGVDAGPCTPGDPGGFGFSEFPSKPALVRVTTRFDTAASTDVGSSS